MNKGRVVRGSGCLPEAGSVGRTIPPGAARVLQPFRGGAHLATHRCRSLLPRRFCRSQQLTEPSLRACGGGGGVGGKEKRSGEPFRAWAVKARHSFHSASYLELNCKHLEPGVYSLCPKRSFPSSRQGEERGWPLEEGSPSSQRRRNRCRPSQHRSEATQELHSRSGPLRQPPLVTHRGGGGG